MSKTESAGCFHNAAESRWATGYQRLPTGWRGFNQGRRPARTRALPRRCKRAIGTALLRGDGPARPPHPPSPRGIALTHPLLPSWRPQHSARRTRVPRPPRPPILPTRSSIARPFLSDRRAPPSATLSAGAPRRRSRYDSLLADEKLIRRCGLRPATSPARLLAVAARSAASPLSPWLISYVCASVSGHTAPSSPQELIEAAIGAWSAGRVRGRASRRGSRSFGVFATAARRARACSTAVVLVACV